MIIYRPDLRCSHWIKTSADQWPDVRLSDVDVAEALGKALSVKVAYFTRRGRVVGRFRGRPLRHGDGRDLDHAGTGSQGLFSTPIMQEGKTPIAGCADQGKYQTLADIDQPGTRVIVNPGGTNERFARTYIRNAEIRVYADNLGILDEIIV